MSWLCPECVQAVSLPLNKKKSGTHVQPSPRRTPCRVHVRHGHDKQIAVSMHSSFHVASNKFQYFVTFDNEWWLLPNDWLIHNEKSF